MTEHESTGGVLDMNSKLVKSVLLIVSVLLIFAGPTYIPYLMSNVAHIDYVASVVVGLVLLVAGLLLMWFLIRNKVVQ